MGTAFLRGTPASLGATRGGARKSEAWNAGWEAGFPSRKWAWCSATWRPWLGAVRRGGGACVQRRGRGRLSAPLPRAALSARREAVAVGGFSGLCSGDFGSGASGTSALVSCARPAGRIGSEPDGRTDLSFKRVPAPADRSGRGVGQGPVERTGLGGRARRGSLGRGSALAGVHGIGVGAAAGDLGSGGGGSWGPNRSAWGE